MTVDLDSALRDLAGTLQPADPPDYAARVLARLDDAPRHRPRLQHTRRLLLAAAIVLLGLATTVAVPAGRHALASWLGFSGIDVHVAPRGSTLPAPSTAAAVDPSRPVTLDTARRAAGRHDLALPAGLTRPDRVYLRRDHAAVIITLAYRHAPGLRPTADTGFALIATEIFDAGEPVYTKMLHTNATSTIVQVHGREALFFGGPQEIITLDHTRQEHGDDVVHEIASRASANTIIWNAGGTTYRLEGDFTDAAAVTLAESLR